ncbi:MAG: FtsW/RodA/SpoVE family cell cycle protein [Oscillospiraceae bacterium]|nr:FtsW/RodA/SpoVE family cell cycle protein [Oscillospiraceae bacterium]
MTTLKRILLPIQGYFRTADTLLLILGTIATASGLVMIYSATRTYSGADTYVRVQTFAAAIGMFLFFIFSIVDTDVITDHWPIVFVFNIAFISTLFIWGIEDDTGNSSWLRFLSIGIQPSEVVKISFTLLLAKQLTYMKEQSRGGLNSIFSVSSLIGHFLIIFGLIMLSSNDLGSATVFAFIFIVMLFASGLRFAWFALGALIVGAATPIIWSQFLSPLQRNRIIAPYLPEQVDPTGLGVTWQVNQSRMMLASGKLIGQGYLQGTQSQGSNLLPHKNTDFIFAVIGEELGMLGCLAVILLLLAIIFRCIYIGVKCGNRTKMLFCMGIAGMFTYQTFENIGMCVGLTPVIGLTLPFFSYGGSSVLSSLAALGIVSGIRRSTTR